MEAVSTAQLRGLFFFYFYFSPVFLTPQVSSDFGFRPAAEGGGTPRTMLMGFFGKRLIKNERRKTGKCTMWRLSALSIVMAGHDVGYGF